MSPPEHFGNRTSANSLSNSKMMIETRNNLNGVTLNPHNTALTPGGSSGGESALQALRGSPLGIGSDIGMSLSPLPMSTT